MRNYQKIFKKLLNIIISSNLRHILIQLIGFNNYTSLIMKSINIKGNTRAKKNILCVEKSLFEKDVDELSHRIRKYGWVWLSKKQITVYQDKIIPKKYRGQKKFRQYLDEIPNEWRKCIEMSKILIQKLKEEHNICALLVANIDYSQDYALQVACNELKIPVIILQKEYPYNNNYQSFINTYYSKHFKQTADAIMVFGERSKNIFLELGYFDKSKIFVTGAPRLDRWRSLQLIKGTREGLLIFCFKDELNNINSFLEMLVAVSNFIKKENLGKITIKSRNEIQTKQLLKFCKKEKLDNVEIINYANIYDLISENKVIISSNSLATIESMLSKLPIIIPDWIIKDKNKKMFDPEDELCIKSLEFSKNIESLLKDILKYLKKDSAEVSDETFEARKKFISKFWDYESNITASEKVQKVIDSFVEN